MTSGRFPFWISIDSRLTSEFTDVTDVSWLKPRKKNSKWLFKSHWLVRTGIEIVRTLFFFDISHVSHAATAGLSTQLSELSISSNCSSWSVWASCTTGELTLEHMRETLGETSSNYNPGGTFFGIVLKLVIYRFVSKWYLERMAF